MTDLIARLEKATDGLLYPSETDAPVHVFVWRHTAPFSVQALLVSTGYEQNTPIRTTDVKRFFRPVTRSRDWHDEEEQERRQRFMALHRLLQAELNDIAVYKIGTVEIDVYVVGRTADGTYCGIKTRVVET